ncbi:hypothetical protein BJV74DRAFT_796612 [Russula compacta]|nr:hypothetical protein BJV74DRAFT_796612 [Russula compacta]
MWVGKRGTGQGVRGEAGKVEADVHGQKQACVGRWRQAGTGKKAGVGRWMWVTVGRGEAGEVEADAHGQAQAGGRWRQAGTGKAGVGWCMWATKWVTALEARTWSYNYHTH